MSDSEREHGSEDTSEEVEETAADVDSEEGMQKDPLSDYRTEGGDA